MENSPNYVESKSALLKPGWPSEQLFRTLGHWDIERATTQNLVPCLLRDSPKADGFPGKKLVSRAYRDLVHAPKIWVPFLLRDSPKADGFPRKMLVSRARRALVHAPEIWYVQFGG